MINFLIILILFAVTGGAGYYVYRAKKQGRKCIGCPYAGSCSASCSCGKYQ